MATIEFNFSALDYAIPLCLLLFSLIIGIVSVFKGNNSPEEFLLGNRSLNAYAVSMSLLSSFLSAIHLIGFTTEVYLHGTQLFLISVGCVIGISFAMIFILPVIHPLKLMSIHEYIGLRFRSTTLEILMVMAVLFNVNIQMGACLYATSVALETFTPFSFSTCTLTMGIVCTVYSSLGGIRAVVWADILQLIVMVIGLLIFAVSGIYQLGGIKNVFSIADEGKRIQFLNFNPSLYERHNVYNTIAFGAFYYGAVCGASQVNMQRICSVRTLSESKRVLIYSMIGFISLYILIFGGGLVIYATYAGCDPVLEGKIEKYNQILPFYVMDKLGQIIGLPGIFVATFISSTLSSYSSIVNAQVAIFWKSIIEKYGLISSEDPLKSALVNKIMTFIFGVIFIGMAFLTKKARSIIQLSLSISGVFVGVFFGVVLLGVLVPFSNKKGVWTGVIISYAFIIWIYIGSLQYGISPENLPLSAESCQSITSNVTNEEVSVYFNNTKLFLTNNTDTNSEVYDSSPLLYLYRISYTLYIVIGPVLVVLIGSFVSYLTGDKFYPQVPRELIFQFSRIYPRKKEEKKHYRIDLDELK